MRVWIYARVSQDPRSSGRSVEEQVQEAESWAAREGWFVERVVRETGSASRYAGRDRERWAEVQQAITTRRMDALLTWEFSRATRDLTAYAKLRDACAVAGVLLGYCGTLYDLTNRESRFRTGLDALVAEDEAARTSERVRRAVRANAARGRPHGKALYGYCRVYDSESKALLRVEPHPEQAPVVTEAARRVLTGESLYAVATDLTAREVPPRRPARRRVGLGWTPAAVAQMLKSPAYAGLRVHRGEVIGEAAWPALIDRADWERLQAVLTDPTRRTRPAVETVHLLSGLARCGICGGPLLVGKQNAGRPSRSTGARSTYRSYVCRTPGSAGKPGFHVARRESLLDQAVTEAVLVRLERQDVIEMLSQAPTTEGVERAAVLAELDQLRGYLDRVRARAAEDLDVAALVDQEARLRPRIAAAERRLRQVTSVEPLVLDLAASGKIRDSWAQLSVADRRRVVRSVCVPRIHPVRGQRGQRGLDLDSIEIVWT